MQIRSLKFPRPATVRYAQQAVPAAPSIPGESPQIPAGEIDPSFVTEGTRTMPEIVKDVLADNPQPLLSVLQQHPEVLTQNPAAMDSLLRDANFPVYLSHQPEFVSSVMQNPAFAQWVAEHVQNAAEGTI